MRYVLLLGLVFAVCACDGSVETSSNPDTSTDVRTDVGTGDASSTEDLVQREDMDPDEDTSQVVDSGDPDLSQDTGEDVAIDLPTPECDFEAVNRIVVIEAENLPLIEDWAVATENAGYTGAGYIDWLGPSFNNDPTHGVMEVKIRITEPGRYQLQWHTRIGNGTNTTEHNDSWVKFPDADDYYGLKGDPGAEIRRYWKPACDDPALMAQIEANADVDVANCAMGSTRDGWMKVYSSGANDWRWSAFTSDNDGSAVSAEFGSPGVYTFSMAARADRNLIDRIILHHEDETNATVRDLALAETACN